MRKSSDMRGEEIEEKALINIPMDKIKVYENCVKHSLMSKKFKLIELKIDRII